MRHLLHTILLLALTIEFRHLLHTILLLALTIEYWHLIETILELGAYTRTGKKSTSLLTVKEGHSRIQLRSRLKPIILSVKVKANHIVCFLTRLYYLFSDLLESQFDYLTHRFPND